MARVSDISSTSTKAGDLNLFYILGTNLRFSTKYSVSKNKNIKPVNHIPESVPPNLKQASWVCGFILEVWRQLMMGRGPWSPRLNQGLISAIQPCWCVREWCGEVRRDWLNFFFQWVPVTLEEKQGPTLPKVLSLDVIFWVLPRHFGEKNSFSTKDSARMFKLCTVLQGETQQENSTSCPLPVWKLYLHLSSWWKFQFYI